jgi:hypothetical protein
MNVRQLIQELEMLPQDAEVHFQYNYGDYWRTQVAPKVSTIDLGKVEFSEYHRMDCLVEEDEDNDTPYTEEGQVVIIG